MGTNTSGLIPFDSERGRQMAARSADVRRARALERSSDASQVASALDGLADRYERDRLGEYAGLVACHLLGEIAAGRLKVRSSDAPALLRVVVDIARLEAGQATSHTLTARLDGDSALARVLELRDA